jgi:hypothetical protein
MSCRRIIRSFVPLILVTAVLWTPHVAAQSVPDSALWLDSTVATVRIWIHPDSLAAMYRADSLNSDHEYPASFAFDNGVIRDSAANVGFRLRGNTSRFSKKKSFKVSFNTFVSGGAFHGIEKLNLNGEHNDPTISRARVCWDLFRAFGVPGSRTHHTRVYINGAYYGLYLSVEHIDENFALARFGNNTGNLYKCTWPADLTWRGNDPNVYRTFTSGGDQVYEMHINDDVQDYMDLAQFITFVNRAPAEDFERDVETWINVPGFLKVLAVDAAVGSWDDYWFNANNYYLYHNMATKRFEFIPYDYDNTLGIWWSSKMAGVDIGTRDLITWGHPTQLRPLASRILGIPRYAAWYRHYLYRFFNELFVTPVLAARVDAIHVQITPAAEADTWRTLDYKYTIAQFHTSFASPLGAHVPYGLKHYVDVRRTAAMFQLSPIAIAPIILGQRYSYEGADSVTITAIVEDDASGLVVAAHLVTGAGAPATVPLYDDGLHGDGAAGDGTYGGRIRRPGAASTTSYFIRVTDASANVSHEPANAPTYLWQIPGTFVAGPLAVNEIMASNASVITDPAGEHDDWIEIINVSGSTVALHGKYLTDNLSRPNKWALPDTTLPPGGIALIWADDQSAQGPFHATFKLDKAGEAVGIFDSTVSGFVVMDSVTYGSQETDVSLGRYPDGQGSFARMHQPTPGHDNTLTAVEEGRPRIPEGFVLHETYPDPFNPSTFVTFELPAASEIRLAAYDLLGREVRVLASGHHDAGVFRTVFDATGLASGVYVIRMEGGGKAAVRKCVLMK